MRNRVEIPWGIYRIQYSIDSELEGWESMNHQQKKVRPADLIRMFRKRVSIAEIADYFHLSEATAFRMIRLRIPDAEWRQITSANRAKGQYRRSEREGRQNAIK